MKKLVKLRQRPSRDGKTFVYHLDYINEDGKRSRPSLGHADWRKADRQRKQKERELRMGIVEPESMKLGVFLDDSLARTGKQINESTHKECRYAMNHFIDIVGNIDYQRVTLKHAELFLQKCLDGGNKIPTVVKKIAHLKRIFQLAVNRKQLEENPFARVKCPKCPKKKIRVYSSEECERILRVAFEVQAENSVQWGLIISVDLGTAMRRGEILNCIWNDIDFENKVINISPKENTSETWEWQIKDAEHRAAPLTDELVDMLAKHQSQLSEGYPYVFIPPIRYGQIQKRRKEGNWTYSDSRLSIIGSFTDSFNKILKRAKVDKGKFHDLRSTAISDWFAEGMKELEIMKLAGHSSFETTHKFYLAVEDDLIDKARDAKSRTLDKILARTWHAPVFSSQKD